MGGGRDCETGRKGGGLWRGKGGKRKGAARAALAAPTGLCLQGRQVVPGSWAKPREGREKREGYGRWFGERSPLEPAEGEHRVCGSRSAKTPQ